MEKEKEEFNIYLVKRLYMIINFLQNLTSTWLLMKVFKRYGEEDSRKISATVANLFWSVFSIIVLIFGWENIFIVSLFIFRLWEICIINIWLFLFKQGASQIKDTEKNENYIRLFVLLVVQYFTMIFIFAIINNFIFCSDILSFNFASMININSVTWLYYSVVTITTVGYGDITPVSNIARFSSISEILFGMFFILLFISNTISNLKFNWYDNTDKK